MIRGIEKQLLNEQAEIYPNLVQSKRLCNLFKI